MSGLDETHETPSPAEAIRIRAGDWVLERRSSESWNAEDQAALDAWLAEDTAHLLAYWRLDAAWDKTYRLAALAPQQMRANTPRKDWLRRSVTRLAAGLAVIALFGAAASLFYTPASNETVYATPVGGQRIITLADGSRVELNTDTVLRVSNTGHRAAVLEKGQAYFQIVHDETRPFVVTAGDHKITDLGTAFMVRKETSRLEVALVEGEARVDAPRAAVGPRSALLRPGDVVVATDEQLTASHKTIDQLTDELGWRRGVLVFKGATLAAAAAEFNRYNTRKIYIADAKAARIKIGGTFQATNIDTFAQAARDLFGLKVEQRGEETVISR